MKLSFKYKTPVVSEIQAPYLPIILSDPLEIKSIEVTALIDTGFDGEILIPRDLYDDLNLKAYEYSMDVVSIAETATGEQLELISASGSVQIKGLDLISIITVDSHKKCREVIIGRQFLESYHTLLKGPEKELEIELMWNE
ncbi:MAG: clan AA aspartic protease [Candidatus Helarchaeota archaeon]